MVMDPDIEREEELNRRRAEQIEEASEGRDDDEGVVETVDRVFDSVIKPPAAADDLPTEDEEAERRRLNDEATREA